MTDLLVHNRLGDNFSTQGILKLVLESLNDMAIVADFTFETKHEQIKVPDKIFCLYSYNLKLLTHLLKSANLLEFP